MKFLNLANKGFPLIDFYQIKLDEKLVNQMNILNNHKGEVVGGELGEKNQEMGAESFNISFIIIKESSELKNKQIQVKAILLPNKIRNFSSEQAIYFLNIGL